MKHVGLSFSFIGFIFLLTLDPLCAQEQKSGKELVQLSIGEANKWANTRYLLYSATGASTISGLSDERTFLIDKKTGDCRFEGVTKNGDRTVLLFNYKTKRVKKYFINSQESKSTPDSLIENVLDQFFSDTQILFLPALLNDSPSSIKETSQKILNTEKINVLSFANLPTLGDDTINGKILLTNKGEVKSIVLENTEYITSASKDIGEGILLPTVFQSQSTYRFHTVAAFTEMEAGKFTTF